MVVMGEETSTARSQFIWIDLSAIWLQPQQHRARRPSFL
jgi:hypothetical protein